MPKTLSKEAESQIIEGVKTAVAETDAGADVNTVVEKLARDYSWGPDMVRFAAHAYNTGRQMAQFNTEKTALAKFASFPLADAESVIGRIWSPAVKSAASVSDEYTRPPQHVLMQKRAQDSIRLRSMTKTAAVKCKTCGMPVPDCTCKQKKGYVETSRRHQQLKVAAETARQEASTAYDVLVGSMSALSGYFAKSAMDRVAFADAELMATVNHGSTGAGLMEWVYVNNRLKEARHGAAGVKYAGAAVDPGVEPYNLISRCVTAAAEVNSSRDKEAAARDAADNFYKTDLLPLTGIVQKTASWDLVGGHREHIQYDTSNQSLYLLQPPVRFQRETVKEAAAVPQEWSLLRGKSAEGGGNAFSMVLPTAVASTTRKMLDDAMTGGDADNVQSATAKLDDPAHDAALRSIRTQAMLSDLMNDPGIGSHDPDEVARTYNELSQLAPRSAQQPMVMRALLRRHLEGNVQPFETRETLDTENALKSTAPAAPPTDSLIRKPTDAKSIFK